ncbi:MAG: S1-like domain-containing RNA-binding protein [Akkermansiaceae bacterium]
MAEIGERVTLPVVREVSAGLILDGGNLGEVLLPRIERQSMNQEEVEVFLYRDSEDRPVATERLPKVMPGSFGALRVVSSNNTGAFLDWGLAKDLLLPFSEQRGAPKAGALVVVAVYLDPKSRRLVASQRIDRHFGQDIPDLAVGEEVELLVYGKTDLGYKVIVEGQHSGLLFQNQVFEELHYGGKRRGYVVQVRPDRKIDLSLTPHGKAGVDDLESRLIRELEARGGYLDLNDKSPPELIYDELGVSKKVFKKATGALYRKRLIVYEDEGIRWVGDQ